MTLHQDYTAEVASLEIKLHILSLIEEITVVPTSLSQKVLV